MLTHPHPACPLQTVQELVARAGTRPDRLLLVGGFGSSLYLRGWLQGAFGNSMGELITPTFAYSAIVEGAVLFLQRPTTIAARVSSMTYGVQVRGASAACASAAVAGHMPQGPGVLQMLPLLCRPLVGLWPRHPFHATQPKPNQTKPNQTKPNQTKPRRPAGHAALGGGHHAGVHQGVQGGQGLGHAPGHRHRSQAGREAAGGCCGAQGRPLCAGAEGGWMVLWSALGAWYSEMTPSCCCARCCCSAS
jgi:hypothetical protein